MAKRAKKLKNRYEYDGIYYAIDPTKTRDKVSWLEISTSELKEIVKYLNHRLVECSKFDSFTCNVSKDITFIVRDK